MLAVGLLGATGCVDIGSRLVIAQNQVPETKEGCVIPGERTETYSSMGLLDVDLDDDSRYYALYPLIENQLPSIQDNKLAADLNIVRVERMEVDVELPPGVNILSTSACPLSYSVDVGGTTIAPGGTAGLYVRVLRPCLVNQLNDLFNSNQLPRDSASEIILRVNVRAAGKHGRGTIESDPFRFPIRVCQGCLQRGYPEPWAVFDYPRLASCDQLLPPNPFPGNPCNAAQDFGPVLCCVRGNNAIECPGRPSGMPATN